MKLAANFDRVTLPLPAGVKLRSAADRRSIDTGIEVSAIPVSGPQRAVRFEAVPSGHWVAHLLPGVPVAAANDPGSWASTGIPFRFAVDDPRGRFLPLRFTSPLPERGALRWAGWSGWTGQRRNRARPILPPGAVGSALPEYLPLFPGPGWKAEPGLADISAQLAIRETGGALRNAGWAIATIAQDSKVIGLGVADGEGRLVVAFPYPPLPPQTSLEAAQGRKKIAWDLRVRIYCRELAADVEPGDVPELQDILAQLDHPPIRALATIMGSQPELAHQELVLGEPLVLRTAIGGGKLSSSLFLKSP